MFSIEQSHFLQALGQAIGHSLWQVAALWLAYAAISNVGRLSANRRYQLAASASLAGFVWFVITLVYACAAVPVQQPGNGMYAETVADAGSSFPDYLSYVYHSIFKSIQSLAPYISCAYLLLFGVLSIRLRNGFKQVKFFATQGLEKSGVEWRLFVQQHAAALGISRRVHLYISQHVQSPLTIGFWKPIILMPVASLSQLTTAQVESILLHELAHIRRHDYLINIFLQISEISLFFNPFMRLLLKQVKQERENSCDDYVLQFQYSPKDYAKALLAIQHSNNTALLALAAKGNESFQLLNRVKRMVAPQPKAFNYRQQLGLLLLFTVLMLGFTVIVPRPKQATYKAATAVAKNSIPEKKRLLPAMLPESPAADIPPSSPQGYDIIKDITNYPDLAEQMIDEKALAAMEKEMEVNAEEIEAISREVQAKMKPFTDQVTAWANTFSDSLGTESTHHYLNALQNLKELKNLPVESLTEISEEYQKKLMAKINHLLKASPFIKNLTINRTIAFNNNWQRASATAPSIATTREKVMVAGRADYVRQQAAKNNFVYREVQKEEQRAINIKIPGLKALQEHAEVKQLEAMAKMERLHLGLLTDDRDTCKAEGDGLLAKLQPHKPNGFNMHFKTNSAFTLPEIRVNGKQPGKCVITVTKDNVKIVPEVEDNDPAFFKINGQNIDIRHEKQMNNGKEENVVIISISNSK